MSRRATCTALLLFSSRLLAGAASEDGLFTEVTGSARLALTSAQEQRDVVPDAYRVFQVDPERLRQRLADAPPEGPGGRILGSVTMTLPFPDGSFERFRVVESSIMDPLLQAKFPEIRTYRAVGLDDPTAVGRLDRTPAGFHAMVRRAGGTVFVDPFSRGNATTVISYFRRDFVKRGERFLCGVVGDLEAALARASAPLLAPPSSGPTLRTYRLALAANVEYTTYHGGKTGAMAAMTTTLNRVNGVYERDVAVRMVFVADEENLIFTTEPDGYTNNNPGQMLTANRSKLDSIIGSSNYDIGHVFGTQSGGLAGLGVVCISGQKSAGTTGITKPVGDPFDIDYVAHEMGHQFGANHPFNGSTGACGGENREPRAAYEPGSGSTIMAYAGICGGEDLQPHSDDYFHAKSVEEILLYTADSGGICPTKTPTGNTSPAIGTLAGYSIPKETPFALTASATDADAADAGKLTYCWEEYDLGPEGPPNTDDGSRPILRSYLPTTSPTRTFPSMKYVLANGNVPPATYRITGSSKNWLVGESLPSTNRTMAFRVTVRDNRPGGEAAAGGLSMADTGVTVVSAAGPFNLTAPNTAVTWPAPSTQTVTWSVAGTTAAPVSCSEVRLLLSTDGGSSFPIVLSERTANDGSESVTLPKLDSTKARVKVEASGNIFFDVSDVDFKLESPNAAPSAVITSPSGDPAVQAGVAVAFAGSGTDPDGDTLTYSWSFGDGSAAATGATPAPHPFANAGSYVVTLTVTDPRGATATATRTVTVAAPTLSGPSLLVPVVLETAGTGGSFYTTELTLASRAATSTEVLMTYTASAGGGSGFARLTLAAGEQRIVSSVIAALRAMSLPIPADGTKVGTLLLTFGGAAADVVFAGARTFTRDPQGGAGTFGLFYAALPSTSQGLTVYGLLQNAAQRSNLALVNAGASAITLRVNLRGAAAGQDYGNIDQTLGPWGWAQLNSPLDGKTTSGRAVVTRISGTSPFTAYGVLNDATTSDGSFIPPLLAGDTSAAERLVPIVLSTGGYRTELTVANETAAPLALTFVYAGSPQLSAQGSGSFSLSLAASEQRSIPDAIGFLRENGLSVPATGASAGGSLMVRAAAGTPASSLGVGARTFIAGPAGGTFGLFYPGLTLSESATSTAWIYGLQQNDVQRSNVAMVNRGDAGDSITLRVTYYSATGVESGSTDSKTLAPGEWGQFNAPLTSRGITAGYAKIERISGASRFLAYGVLNDQVNSDGSYVPMTK